MVEKAFAMYYLPQQEEPQLICGEAVHMDQLQGDGFVFVPYEEKEDCAAWQITSEHCLRGIEELSAFAKENTCYNYSAIDTILPVAKEDFVLAVANGVQRIKESDTLTKIVLSRPLFQDLKDDFDPWQTLQELHHKMPNAFCFWVSIPKVGMWMGATPERLLEVKDGKAQTNALAATLPAEASQEWSAKAVDEQQIVSDYIAVQLAKAGIEAFTFTGPETVVSGSVKHLKSVFDFSLESKEQLQKTVVSLHPTPAVCGMPKDRAAEEIAQLENYSRSYYTGFLGPINGTKESHLFVNLRSMQVGKTSACLYVGAGITEGSDPESEWEETGEKAKTLLNVLEED